MNHTTYISISSSGGNIEALTCTCQQTINQPHEAQSNLETGHGTI